MHPLEKIVVEQDHIPLGEFQSSWPQFPYTEDYFINGQGQQAWMDGESEFEFTDTETGSKVCAEIKSDVEVGLADREGGGVIVVEAITYFLP